MRHAELPINTLTRSAYPASHIRVAVFMRYADTKLLILARGEASFD